MNFKNNSCGDRANCETRTGSHDSQVSPSAALKAVPDQTRGTRAIVLIASSDNLFARQLLFALQKAYPAGGYRFLSTDALALAASANRTAAGVIYVPDTGHHERSVPCLSEASRVFDELAALDPPHVILISSAEIYGIGHSRQSMVSEAYATPGGNHEISSQWRLLEQCASQYLNDSTELTVLRLVTVHPSPSPLSRRLRRRLVLTLPGHDPMLQLLSLEDAVAAINCAVERPRPGVFNVAGDHAIPLHAAIRLARKQRIPIPRTLQRIWANSEELDWLRYPATVANSRIKEELEFMPRSSSLAALREQPRVGGPVYDEFGMDRGYIDFYSKTLFRLVAKYYWRIEVGGLENIPAEGRAVLAGTHRGFMPFDGVMTLHTLVSRCGRVPRFLTHPGLFKFPFLANFMTKLGGILACQDSAERVLQTNQLLAIFPEGIQGAFTHYRDAYRVQSFGRHTFVKLALKNQAPIIPFVIVGSAEIFPIFGKIKSRLWNRYTEWPFIPITPTFPWLPIPLPSKWHIQFLPPIHVEDEFPPEAARNAAAVKAISTDVRARMQNAFDELLARRRSVFRGSILDEGSR